MSRSALFAYSLSILVFGCTVEDPASNRGNRDPDSSVGLLDGGPLADSKMAPSDSGGKGPTDAGPRDAGHDSGPPPPTDAGQGCHALTMTIRDLSLNDGQPDPVTTKFDFNGTMGRHTGLVTAMLGGDGKPVYGNPDPTQPLPVLTNKASFDRWWNDTGGVNMTYMDPLMLTQTSPGVFSYDNGGFFIVDGRGFGNQGLDHNYFFTIEMRATFMYRGGEYFTVRNDDDTWVYINGRLAIDMGGVAGPTTGMVSLDGAAGMLGISPGNRYELKLFHAERDSRTGSTFHIDTSIGCLRQ